MDLDKLLILYLFDPDKGLEEEITAKLNQLSQTLESMEALEPLVLLGLGVKAETYEARREKMEADVVLYTEVWGRIRAGKEALSPLVADDGQAGELWNDMKEVCEESLQYTDRVRLLLEKGWHKHAR